MHKTLRVFLVGRLQNLLPLVKDGLGASEMNVRGREQAESAVVMFVVVPAKEGPGPKAGIHLTPKAGRVIRAIFQGFELGFGNAFW